MPTMEESDPVQEGGAGVIGGGRAGTLPLKMNSARNNYSAYSNSINLVSARS